jgi:protein TonB
MAGPMALRAFDSLIDDARAEALLRHARGPQVPHRTAPTRAPELELGGYVVAAHDPAARRRGIAIPASMLLHGAAAVALAIVPLLVADSLPGNAEGVRAFFAEPIALPPAPPPPPPAPARSAIAPRVAPRAVTQPVGFTAPIEVPTEIKPEEGLALGIEGGVPGGVEGGVPGGVVGGIVGGLPDAPPPPPVVKAVRVGGDVRPPRKVVDVPAVYPQLAIKAQLEGTVVIEATIDPTGHVANATVLRSIALLDEAALEAVKKWVYTPTLLNGVPTPIIMTVTVTFRLQHTARG